jgi:hypothetical protein
VDELLRGAERSGDPVRLLHARVRLGEISEQELLLAAQLGHPVAMQLVEAEGKVGHTQASRRECLEVVCARVGFRAMVHYAFVVTSHACESNPRVTARQRTSLSEFLATVRQWLECPCGEHVLAARGASEAASRWGSFGSESLLHAARAVHNTTKAAVQCFDAEQRGELEKVQSVYLATIEMAADRCLRAAGAGEEDEELAWQQRRLAAYLMDEVQLP